MSLPGHSLEGYNVRERVTLLVRLEEIKIIQEGMRRKQRKKKQNNGFG